VKLKRGRPSDQYPGGEFRGVVLEELTRRSLSLRVLELLSGVNRGTLSAVLNGKRPCERHDRAAILRALGFAPEHQSRFFSVDATASGEHDRILLDGRLASNPGLQLGQRFMSSAQFPDAYRQFRETFEVALADGDTMLQAEAAGILGWFHGELERFEDARRWLLESIRLIENDLKMRTDEIVEAIDGSAPISAVSQRPAQILARALRIYGKILSVKILHDLDYAWLPETRRTFHQSIRLDERLRLPELPHNLRWNAVALAAEDGSTLQKVDALLSASRELMQSGSPGEASLIREQGVVRWQKSRLARAWDLLSDAKERLTYFADARALGPTFCVLSKISVQADGSHLQARRYALIAAALHPCGYVLDHCAELQAKTPAQDRLRDFDSLLAGEKPFDIVHHVLARVAEGSPSSAIDLVQRNLSKVRQVAQPPSRVSLHPRET
jgi:hypothetical protein